MGRQTGVRPAFDALSPTLHDCTQKYNPACTPRSKEDPRLDASLTQYHRGMTSGRERRVCQQQETQEAAREQGRVVRAAVEPHGQRAHG